MGGQGRLGGLYFGKARDWDHSQTPTYSNNFAGRIITCNIFCLHEIRHAGTLGGGNGEGWWIFWVKLPS
jgi:hypothetical protein